MTLEILLQDEAFMAHIVGLETGDDVKKAFADKGYELTDEELQNLAIAIQNIADSGELSDEDLDDVAGGRIYYVVTGPDVTRYLMRNPRIRKLVQAGVKWAVDTLNKLFGKKK